MGRLPSRVVALGLAAVSIAVTGGAIAAGRSESPEPFVTPVASPPGPGLEPFHALWPERTRAKAEAAQEAADRGDAPEWRLEAVSTASEFTKRVMGWKVVVEQSGGCIRDCDFDENHQGFNVHHDCLVCEAIVVVVDRLVRPGEGGVWSVTEVASQVAIDLEPGAVVSADDEVFTVPPSEGTLPLADGTSVQSGFFIGGTCGITNTGPGAIEAGRVEVFVDAFTVNECAGEDGTDGYLVAMRTELREVIFDPLHLPLAGRRLKLIALAAVPVRFEATPVEVEQPKHFDDASDFVRRFMSARLAGLAVDEMLSEAAVRQYATQPNRLNLARVEGVRHRFRIDEVVRPQEAGPDGGFTATVVIFRHHEAETIPVRIVEALFLEPGFNSEGDEAPLVVRAGGQMFGGSLQDPCLHGGACWAVYLAVGPHEDAEVKAQADRLRQLGFESYPEAFGIAGPGSPAHPGSKFWSVSAGAIGADAGAVEALGVSNDSDAAVVYFTSEDTARAFAKELDPPPVAIVQIVIFGAD